MTGCCLPQDSAWLASRRKQIVIYELTQPLWKKPSNCCKLFQLAKRRGQWLKHRFVLHLAQNPRAEIGIATLYVELLFCPVAWEKGL